MASERQIAANRRNAGKSPGPRSAGGKKRASQNAHQHGLAAAIPLTRKIADEIELLARKFADGIDSPIVRAYARSAAESSLELARVARVKVALIESLAVFVYEEGLPAIDPVAEAVRRALPDLIRLDRYERRATARRARAIRMLNKS